MFKRLFGVFWLGAGFIAVSTGLAAPAHAECTDPTNPTCYQRPAPLGVSGSSQTLVRVNSLLYCYAGTLGSLMTDGAHQYILSNNHVLAKENHNLDYGSASDNDTIIQEANLDEGTCSISSGNPDHAVADLTDFVPISFYKGKFKSTDPANTVDAAIAKVSDGTVDPSGYILGIGTIDGAADSNAIVVGMPVQKTGRTTAHTFGKIAATDVTVDVSYESGKARFVNQIRIRRPCDDAGFSDAGDSGSLIATVAPVDENGNIVGTPQAVGLLFAGGSTDTFANTIGDVLSAVNMNMVSSSPASTDSSATMTQYNAIADACPTGGSTGGGGNGHGHGPKSANGGPVGLDIARDVQARHSAEIFALPGVVGHGIGADANGNAVIEIYVTSKGRRPTGFPSEFEGVPVRIIETGPVRAY